MITNRITLYVEEVFNDREHEYFCDLISSKVQDTSPENNKHYQLASWEVVGYTPNSVEIETEGYWE